MSAPVALAPNAPQPGSRYDYRGFVHVGGADVWVEAEGDGMPLLLIPGLGAGTWLWDAIRDDLSPHFRLIMPELRGSGRSVGPDERYTVAGFARDCVSVLDALGVPAAHVVGASLGGFVAAHIAAEWPERICRLVLAATSVGGQNQIGPSGDVLARTIRPRGRTRRERLFDTYSLGFSDSYLVNHAGHLDALTERRMEHPQTEPTYYRQLLAGSAYDGSRTVERVVAPTLICAGTDDIVVPVDNAYALRDAIAGSRVELFPGRHLFFYESGPAFSRSLISFLRDERRESHA